MTETTKIVPQESNPTLGETLGSGLEKQNVSERVIVITSGKVGVGKTTI